MEWASQKVSEEEKAVGYVTRMLADMHVHNGPWNYVPSRRGIGGICMRAKTIRAEKKILRGTERALPIEVMTVFTIYWCTMSLLHVPK